MKYTKTVTRYNKFAKSSKSTIYKIITKLTIPKRIHLKIDVKEQNITAKKVIALTCQ